MTAAILSALWAHWRRAPLQLVAVVLGLALSTALWSGVQAINAEARASYDAAAATLGESAYDQLVPREGMTVPQAVFVALRRAGWQVSPVIEGRLPGTGQGLRVIGLDPLTAPGGLVPINAQSSRAGAPVDLAAFLAGQTAMTAPDSVSAARAALEMTVIAEPALAPGVILMDIGAAQRLLDLSGQLTRMIILPDQPLGRAELGDAAPSLIRRAAQNDSDVGRLTDSFHLNLTAFGLLSFAVGLFIVQGTVRLAFEQRRGLVRSLRAMGVPLRGVIWALSCEILLLAIGAGALGIALGYVLAAALLPDVAATLRGLYGADVAGTVQLRPVWWVSGLTMAVVGAGLAAAGALWQIARMPILASARPRAWAMQGAGPARVLAGMAALLWILAAAVAVWGTGIVAGFAVLGGLLIGAALALPPLLRLGLHLAQARARGPVTQWFWAATAQQVPGLSLALMALLLATATNVGVSTMVSSFRLTFTGFLDQRLAPELYLAFDTQAEARRVAPVLDSYAREVLPVVSVQATVAGHQAQVFGVTAGPTYRENWHFLASDGAATNVWDRVSAGQAAVINEQLARRADLWPGDLVSVTTDITLPVGGVVADYGNPVGQVVLGETLFRTHFPEARAQRFGLRSDDPARLRDRLIDELGVAPGSLIDQAQIKRFSLQVFDRTFTVTAALNVLTLAVAGFAILMSLLTLAAQRVPQLAPVWALGLTRARLGQLELARALALALVTVVLAIPLGLALAWVLLNVVNVAAFGWQLPMFLFPGAYLDLAFWALAAAALAATWPAWRLSRKPPSELLKVFANDR